MHNKITFQVAPKGAPQPKKFQQGQLYVKVDNRTTVYICATDGKYKGTLLLVNLQTGSVWSSDSCADEYEGWEGFHPYDETLTINKKD